MIPNVGNFGTTATPDLSGLQGFSRAFPIDLSRSLNLGQSMMVSRARRFSSRLRAVGFFALLINILWPAILTAERVPGTYPISINTYADGVLRPCVGVKGDRPFYLVNGVEELASPQTGFWLLSAAEFAPG
jgi:hypothetical protein